MRTYTKRQIIASQKYAPYRDILAAILQEREYTQADLKKEISKFLKGKVK